jgi:HAE1 family hydrophobic/amphiphilic exporter-1
LARVGEIYGRLIGWSLRHRAAVLGIGIASLVLALALARFIGAEFVPKADLSRFVIQFSTPVGSALDYTAAKTGQIEAIVREYPEVTDTYTTINSGNAQGKHNATMTVLLKPRRERTRSQQELMPILRERVGRIAGVEIRSVMGLGGGGPGGKTVQVSLQGADLNELARLSQAFTAELAQIDGLVDIESSMKAAKPALDIDVKRDIAGSLGFSPAQIGAALRPLIAGDAVTTWLAPDGENYDVNPRLPKTERSRSSRPFSSISCSAAVDVAPVPATSTSSMTPDSMLRFVLGQSEPITQG